MQPSSRMWRLAFRQGKLPVLAALLNVNGCYITLYGLWMRTNWAKSRRVMVPNSDLILSSRILPLSPRKSLVISLDFSCCFCMFEDVTFGHPTARFRSWMLCSSRLPRWIVWFWSFWRRLFNVPRFPEIKNRWQVKTRSLGTNQHHVLH